MEDEQKVLEIVDEVTKDIADSKKDDDNELLVNNEKLPVPLPEDQARGVNRCLVPAAEFSHVVQAFPNQQAVAVRVVDAIKAAVGVARFTHSDPNSFNTSNSASWFAAFSFPCGDCVVFLMQMPRVNQLIMQTSTRAFMADLFAFDPAIDNTQNSIWSEDFQYEERFQAFKTKGMC